MASLEISERFVGKTRRLLEKLKKSASNRNICVLFGIMSEYDYQNMMWEMGIDTFYVDYIRYDNNRPYHYILNDIDCIIDTQNSCQCLFMDDFQESCFMNSKLFNDYFDMIKKSNIAATISRNDGIFFQDEKNKKNLFNTNSLYDKIHKMNLLVEANNGKYDTYCTDEGETKCVSSVCGKCLNCKPLFCDGLNYTSFFTNKQFYGKYCDESKCGIKRTKCKFSNGRNEYGLYLGSSKRIGQQTAYHGRCRRYNHQRKR